VSDQTTPTTAAVPPPDEQSRVETAAADAGRSTSESAFTRVMASPAGRNLGLVIALVILVIVGAATAGDRFMSVDNMLTILRLASVVGVVSIGMTFVIVGGGIDLSVGAIVALASVWATTLATQTMAADYHWIVMVFVALAVGTCCGLVNGVLVAYGRIAPFVVTLAMLASARGLAEIIADRKTQIVTSSDFVSFFGGSVLGVPVLVIMFALVSITGWVLLNRTTFGRRTLAVGGIAAVMIMARTTTGSSTHGSLYELEAIAAVVIGGTLLSGGRGTIVGTVLGVLIFRTLTNVFTLNNKDTSTQAVATGVIIIVAVLLQQRVAARTTKT
jgi:ribose transport system permease protein